MRHKETKGMLHDNTLGGNWEESCYQYGTPQEPNQQA